VGAVRAAARAPFPTVLTLAVLAAAGALAGCAGDDPAPLAASTASAAVTATTAQGQGDGQPTAGPTPTPSAPRAIPVRDRRAGLVTTSSRVAWSAGGKLKTVPGRQKAPGRGRVDTIRVEVESGLKLDQQAFAHFVMSTLNDRRSWTEGGERTFARTDGPADIRVVLASPERSAAMCLPLRTFGKLSCHADGAAVLTMYRWVKAVPEYAGDHDSYRRYVVNHEVGHALGHGHEYCAGKGKVAPLMMQQTKGLKGCRPNPWPFPNA
jgi:hypothetical protein